MVNVFHGTPAVLLWASVMPVGALLQAARPFAGISAVRPRLQLRAYFNAARMDEKAPWTEPRIRAEVQLRSTTAREWDTSFRRRRLIVFIFTVLGYSAYYLVRNSIYYTAPAMVASPALGLDITAIGVITSVFPLTYGCSKFVSGVVGDVLSPSIMLSTGLALTACVNVLFGCGSTLGWFATLWALNGILQGWGGPACAKLISAWYAGGERGTYWGLWNISHNFGAFLAPLLAGTAAVRLGWRAGVWAPAAVALVISALVALAVRDSPEKMGRVSAETAWAHARGEQTEVGHEIAENRTEIGEIAQLAPGAVVDVSELSTGAATQSVAVVSTTPAATTTPRAEMDAMVGANVQSGDGMIQRLLTNVLSSGRIWVLALAFLCVYLLRQGLTTWLVFYLVETQGVANFSQAAARVSGLELGGLVGSLYAGRLSDHMIARARPGQGFVGRRLLVVRGYLLGLFGALASLRTLPNVWWLQWLTVFGVGFFLYGPQVRMSTESPLGWPL